MIIAFICIVLIFNTMETISIHRPKIVVIGSCNTDMVVKPTDYLFPEKPY